jgi:formate/nitrite transporter FocA (FNT family)
VVKVKINLFVMVRTMVQSLNLWHLMQKKQAKPIYAVANSQKTHHFVMVPTGICNWFIGTRSWPLKNCVSGRDFFMMNRKDFYRPSLL